MVLSHRLRSKASAFVLAFIAACLLFTSAAQGPASGVDSIRMEELRQKVTYIASEKFKGRGNGTAELNMAAEYIAGIFEKNGLKPAAPRYYQSFDLYTSRLGTGNEMRIRGAGVSSPEGWKLNVREDFVPERWSVSGVVTAPMVFVEQPTSNSSSLRGKIAVVLEGRGPADDPEFPENAAVERTLEASGAVGVVVVQDSADRRSRVPLMADDFRDDLPPRMVYMGVMDSPEYPGVPVVVVSPDVGLRLIPGLMDSQNKIEATITVAVTRKPLPTQNVVGLIEGSNPALRNEVMVVGAHYDHDGEAYGQTWYGADDNGSGTAALLELAEAFGNGAPRPARTVLLCAWAGEEKGLLGSRYYASHPLVPLKRTVAMFQMDMIGRNEDHPSDPAEGIPDEKAADNANSLNVLGSAYSPDLKSAISRWNAQTGLVIHFRYDFGAQDLLRRSDQWSFLSRGIPAVFFFSGLHPDYHTPRDTAAKINYPKLEKVAKLVYLTAFEIANSPAPPRYVKPSAAQKVY